MDVERTTLPSQVYKNPDWQERKKELKASRNQRTTKSIKNIKVIDTPCDSNFNCTPRIIPDCSMDAPPANVKPKKYCDITGYQVGYFLTQTKYKDTMSGLYFYDKDVKNYLKVLSKPICDQFLCLRGDIPIDRVV